MLVGLYTWVNRLVQAINNKDDLLKKRIYFQLADAMWDARDTLEGNEFEPSFVKDFMKVFKEFDKWDSKHKLGATL